VSYCKCGKESDIYLISTLDGYQCMKCDGTPIWHVKSRKQALDKLFMMRKEGLKIPQHAIDRLTQEIKEEKWTPSNGIRI
jgi:hypothetical protein